MLGDETYPGGAAVAAAPGLGGDWQSAPPPLDWAEVEQAWAQQGSLVLYHALFSTCSQKVRFVLGQKQLAFESRVMSLPDGEHLDNWYLAINPNGVVPSLTEDGHAIHDSSVIIEYLDETAPGRARMSPSDPVERATMRSWMRYFEEVPTAAIRVPSFNKVFAQMVASRGEDVNRAQRERMPLRKSFYENMTPQGFDEKTTSESEEKLRACLMRVEQSLAAKGPFLMGLAVTLADVVLLPSVVRMDDLGMADAWSDLPHVADWYCAMQCQPGYSTAYPAGSRLSVAATHS